MRAVASRVLDVLRGGLIGAAEVVPGVSGGTIALIVGVYQTLITAVSTLVRAVVGTLTPTGRLARWREVGGLPWWQLVSIGVGMVAAIVVAAAFLEPLLDTYPEETRGVFAGLILASLVIPAKMAGGIRKFTDLLVLLAVAALTFWLTGLPPLGQSEPGALVIVGAAAIAVCALVLPGVSGSFLLLTLGLYQPTIAAVNDRDLGYLGLFLLGALVGVGSFVVILQWLLENRRKITLLVMTGLMAGSLRALWPWQTEQRELLAPGENVLTVSGLMLAGALTVVALIAVEARIRRTGQAG